MSDRYVKLFSLQENLYFIGSPVVISAGALLKDNNTGSVLVQLKFNSISKKNIKALIVKIKQKDTVGNFIGEEVEYQYLDLNARRNDYFGQKNPIKLPNNETRSFDVSVETVVFFDNQVWNIDSNAIWKSLGKKVNIETILKNDELVRQYKIYTSDSNRFYVPQRINDLWICSCGNINHEYEHSCVECAAEYEKLVYPLEHLNELSEQMCERLAKEENEKRATLEAEKQQHLKIVRMFKMGILIIVILTIIGLVVNFIIIPQYKKNQIYESAISLLEEDRFKDAYAVLEQLGEYKDSQEQILDSKYTRAQQYILEEKYQDAMDLLYEIGDYKDSVHLKDSAVESMYSKYVNMIENSEYIDGYDYYYKIKQYIPSDYNEITEYVNYMTVKRGCVGNSILSYDEINQIAEIANNISYFKDVQQHLDAINELKTTVENLVGEYKKDKYIDIKQIWEFSSPNKRGSGTSISDLLYYVQDGKLVYIIDDARTGKYKIKLTPNGIHMDIETSYTDESSKWVGTYTKEY